MRPFLYTILSVALLEFSNNLETLNYAYLDPGTGSYLFQIIIASIIGGLFAFKLFWSKIILFFKNIFSIGKKKR